MQYLRLESLKNIVLLNISQSLEIWMCIGDRFNILFLPGFPQLILRVELKPSKKKISVNNIFSLMFRQLQGPRNEENMCGRMFSLWNVTDLSDTLQSLHCIPHSRYPDSLQKCAIIFELFPDSSRDIIFFVLPQQIKIK